jgi:hypothetical protein
MAMTRKIIVSASLAAALATVGCGGGSEDKTLTVPASANAKTPLPKVELVRGDDHKAQALEGAIARWVQWGSMHFGKTVLKTDADNSCRQQVEDLWYCYVTIDVVKPYRGYKAGPVSGVYTVTRDTRANRLIYITGTQ